MDASTQLQLKQRFRFVGFSTEKRGSNFDYKHPLATANGSVLSAKWQAGTALNTN